MRKILLVDDENDILETTKFTMEAIGYKCITASNGMEGLTKTLAEKPDLVILDMMMPVMTGIEVLKKVREKHSQKEIPVIMLTAVSDMNHVQTILALGVTDYVVKPFDSDMLVEKVKKILGAPQQQMALADKNIPTININWETGNVSDNIVEAFKKMSKLGWEGKTKFIVSIGDLNELSPADMRRIGDGIGAANEERVTLKFVIASDKIKEKFLNFYETKDAVIYNTYAEALDAYKQQKAVRTIERDDIVMLTYEDTETSLINMLKEMFKNIGVAVIEGKKRFILSFADYYDFDKMDFMTIKLVISNFLKYRNKGVDIRFVVPSMKVKTWFKEVSEGINVEFYLNEDEAIEKFKRDCFFSLNEKNGATILTINEQFGQNRMWGIFKAAFRNIFELDPEGKKKILIDLSNLSSLDSKALKLIEGAMGNAKAEGRDVKFVASSMTIIDQFASFQGTKDIKVYPSIEEASGN